MRQPHILIEIYFLPAYLHFFHPILTLLPVYSYSDATKRFKGNDICKAQYLSSLAKQAMDIFMYCSYERQA